MKSKITLWAPSVLCALGPFLTLWLVSVFLPSTKQFRTPQLEVTSSVNTQAFVQRRQRELRDERFQSTVRRSFAQDDLRGMARTAATMPDGDIGLLTTAFDAYFEEDRQAAVDWLQRLTDELCAIGAYDRSLDITSYLQGKKELPDIERRILFEMSVGSITPVLERFTQLVESSDLIDTRQLSIATSLALNERKGEKALFFDWLADLSRTPKFHRLQTTALRHLIGNTPDDSTERGEVYALLESKMSQTETSTHLPEFALQYSPGDPEAAFRWVSSLDTDDAEMREQAYAQVMQQAALESVEGAAHILSSEDFLSLTYESVSGQSPFNEDGTVQQEAGQFYDGVLSAFMDGILTVDPYLALESAEAFVSKELAARYSEAAREIITEGAHLVSANGHACGDPNCTDTH